MEPVYLSYTQSPGRVDSRSVTSVSRRFLLRRTPLVFLQAVGLRFSSVHYAAYSHSAPSIRVRGIHTVMDEGS